MNNADLIAEARFRSQSHSRDGMTRTSEVLVGLVDAPGAAEAREKAAEVRYEQLRQIIDGGSESMTHEDAIDSLRHWEAAEARHDEEMFNASLLLEAEARRAFAAEADRERLRAALERIVNWRSLGKEPTGDSVVFWWVVQQAKEALAEPVETPYLEIDGAEKCHFRHPNKTWCFHDREYHEGWKHHSFVAEPVEAPE